VSAGFIPHFNIKRSLALINTPSSPKVNLISSQSERKCPMLEARLSKEVSGQLESLRHQNRTELRDYGTNYLVALHRKNFVRTLWFVFLLISSRKKRVAELELAHDGTQAIARQTHSKLLENIPQNKAGT